MRRGHPGARVATVLKHWLLSLPRRNFYVPRMDYQALFAHRRDTTAIEPTSEAEGTLASCLLLHSILTSG